MDRKWWTAGVGPITKLHLRSVRAEVNRVPRDGKAHKTARQRVAVSLVRATVVRWLRALVIAAALLARGRGPGAQEAPAAQGSCRFVLGFATLRDLLGPSIVGDCLEDQRFAANGNAEQRTTGGLLVWRKADNWTAFTDGFRTWVNGPYGLLMRRNDERFWWEAAPDGPGGPQPGGAPPPGWRAYRNPAGFALAYPPGWEVAPALRPADAPYQEAVLQGPEGEIALRWGAGFGGGCPPAARVALPVAAETLEACRMLLPDGGEQWVLFGARALAAPPAPPGTEFSARAVAHPRAAVTRAVVLQVFSTLAFAG